jgi:hypothetical protein
MAQRETGRLYRLSCLGGAVAVAALGALTVAAPAQAAPAQAAPPGTTCTISTLPVPAGTTRSGVNTGDPSGRYLVGDAAVIVNGYSTFANLVWVDGQLRDVPLPWPDGVIRGVNSHGSLIGFRSGTGGVQRAWVSRGGRFVDLPTAYPGDAAYPAAINARGDVLGLEYGPTSGPSHVVRWPANRPGTVRVLAVPDGVLGGQPMDIDDDGTAVGNAFSAGRMVGIVWPAHGAPYLLHGSTGSGMSGAYAIRKGWVGGWTDAASGSVPARWNLRTGAVETVDASGPAFDVNAHGTLATTAAVAHRDRLVPLPGLTPGDARAAMTISDRGVAAGFDNDGVVHAVVWRGC